MLTGYPFCPFWASSICLVQNMLKNWTIIWSIILLKEPKVMRIFFTIPIKQSAWSATTLRLVLRVKVASYGWQAPWLLSRTLLEHNNLPLFFPQCFPVECNQIPKDHMGRSNHCSLGKLHKSLTFSHLTITP